MPGFKLLLTAGAAGALLAPSALGQVWTCEVHLPGVGEGGMTFERGVDGRIEGLMTIERRDLAETVETPIQGRWADRIIEFDRAFENGGFQPFVGVAAATLAEEDAPDHIGEVHMGGRFARHFSGAWFAECEEGPRRLDDVVLRPVDPEPDRAEISWGTLSTGPLEIRQTFVADLDEGRVGGRDGADLWFNAVSATERYLTPLNGARLAVMGRRAPTVAQCLQAELSSDSLPIEGVSEGDYVCVRTDVGRPAVFRVNAPIGESPGLLRIGYTTWSRRS